MIYISKEVNMYYKQNCGKKIWIEKIAVEKRRCLTCL